MKRSNRLILLIGVFLAVVAFVGIVIIAQPPAGTTGTQEPTELPTVFAKRDIPLGVQVTADMVETRNFAVASRDTTAFNDVSLVVGKTARRSISATAQLTAADFATSTLVTQIEVPPGKVAIAVQVDQVSGVGTVIRTGDYVDLLVGFTGDKFPVITVNPESEGAFTVVGGINNTSVKLLVQGMQVLGTLLPPPPAQPEGQAPAEPGTALTGQQQIVIVAASPQEAEVIKFAQLDGSISLVLRSARDFVDPNTNEPIDPAPADTTGIVLKLLVDEYGVLVPELVETVTPNLETP